MELDLIWSRRKALQKKRKNKHKLCCHRTDRTRRQVIVTFRQRLCRRRIRSMCSRCRGPAIYGLQLLRPQARGWKTKSGNLWGYKGLPRISCIHFFMQSCRLMCQLLKLSLASFGYFAMMSLLTIPAPDEVCEPHQGRGFTVGYV